MDLFRDGLADMEVTMSLTECVNCIVTDFVEFGVRIKSYDCGVGGCHARNKVGGVFNH
jgi:hypothetical protein